MKRLSALLIMLLHVGIVWGQFEKTYLPSAVVDTIPAEIHKLLTARLEKDKNSIANRKSKEGSFAESLYEKRFEFVVGAFNQDLFIVDDEINSYLKNVLDNIFAFNPALQREISIYALRSDAPNAVSFGDGTIAVTLGLLARLETESQLAFVICHELAHYYSGHSSRRIEELARLNYDKELAKKIKQIKSSGYGQYTRMKSLFTDLGFSLTKHSRGHEFEADSIGLALFVKTGYSLSAPVRTMEILDSADVSLHRNLINFRSTFHHPDYPFKDSWLHYTKSDKWYSSMAKTDDDSTGTHPSCKKRILALERQLQSSDLLSNADRDENLNYIKTKSQFELVETAYHFQQYGLAMFKALMLIERYPRNAYLHAMVGKCLFQLYQSQKNHELGKVLELPDPRFEENYDRFLTFVHSLRLVDLGALSYYYLIKGDEELFFDEHYMYALWMCSRMEVSKLDADKIKEDYTLRFPSGRYLSLMK